MGAKRVLADAQLVQNKTLSHKHSIERKLLSLNEKIGITVADIKDVN